MLKTRGQGEEQNGGKGLEGGEKSGQRVDRRDDRVWGREERRDEEEEVPTHSNTHAPTNARMHAQTSTNTQRHTRTPTLSPTLPPPRPPSCHKNKYTTIIHGDELKADKTLCGDGFSVRSAYSSVLTVASSFFFGAHGICL